MLVLTRKCQESVVVGGAIGGEFGLKVTVVSVRGGRVRLGFDTEPGVPVHRSEVWERLRAESAQPAPHSLPLPGGRAHDARPLKDVVAGA